MYSLSPATGTNSYHLRATCGVSKQKRDLLKAFSPLTAFATFNDSIVCPNLNVGEVSFNTYTIACLTNGQFVYYQKDHDIFTSFNVCPNVNSIWKIEGNQNFHGFNLTVPRGFPLFTNGINNITSISKSAGVTFTLSDLVSNYDSLYFTLQASGFGSVTKKISTSNILTFNNTDLAIMPVSTEGRIYLTAFNASNKTIEDKKFLFVNSAYADIYNVSIVP